MFRPRNIIRIIPTRSITIKLNLLTAIPKIQYCAFSSQDSSSSSSSSSSSPPKKKDQGAKEGEYIPTNMAFNKSIEDINGRKIIGEDIEESIEKVMTTSAPAQIATHYQGDEYDINYDLDDLGQILTMGYQPKFDKWLANEDTTIKTTTFYASPGESRQLVESYELICEVDDAGNELSCAYKPKFQKKTRVDPPLDYNASIKLGFDQSYGYGADDGNVIIKKMVTESMKEINSTDTKKSGDCRFETERGALNSLIARGFTEKFELIDDDNGSIALRIDRINKNLDISDARVIEVHRFEGVSNPDDSMLILAIEATGPDNKKIRGMLESAYGAEASGAEASGRIGEFMQKVSRKGFQTNRQI